MSHYEHSSDILCSSPSQTNLNTSGNSNGKWPLRPGVLVHVNTNHSLLSHQSPPSSPTKSASSDGLDKRKKPSKRSTFLNSTFSAEPSQPSRAAKIKSMFGGGKYAHCDSNGTLPGVFNKSGVVTFKKLDVSIITRQSLSRKRKAPTPCK
ncbi:uncharacterized protein LOC108252866 [Diaphorina citri]|uniref:Uncharacterized protein LOC108252866 n=1 Tax=Diaphorina citri TaxID=121845 RepID=A0A1S4EGI5_DIACI|nr:uncharacterized protein LOC108252866 [Diaphorina citri]